MSSYMEMFSIPVSSSQDVATILHFRSIPGLVNSQIESESPWNGAKNWPFLSVSLVMDRIYSNFICGLERSFPSKHSGREPHWERELAAPSIKTEYFLIRKRLVLPLLFYSSYVCKILALNKIYLKSMMNIYIMFKILLYCLQVENTFQICYIYIENILFKMNMIILRTDNRMHNPATRGI